MNKIISFLRGLFGSGDARPHGHGVGHGPGYYHGEGGGPYDESEEEYAEEEGSYEESEEGKATFLDLDHGTYPYVTSSNPTAAEPRYSFALTACR